ncbi:hypothetical protein CGRA01v4_07352 [Colletotrichum graminicola]|nr:hypothetical protein CGRA01v4_07352 [Colletotrichum graminicola]
MDVPDTLLVDACRKVLTVAAATTTTTTTAALARRIRTRVVE